LKQQMSILAVVLGLAPFHANADQQEIRFTTNEISEITMSLRGFKDTPPPYTFWNRFENGWETRANQTFYDRLHSLRAMRWILPIQGDVLKIHERAGREAGVALSRSLSYAGREAIADTPFLIWLENRQGFLGTLIRGTIADVDEEELEPVGVSYIVAEQSWGRKVVRNGGLEYGVRPYNTSPYAYLSWKLGPRNKPIVLGDVRYYYQDLSGHRFETIVSAPISHGFALTSGVRYDMDRRDEQMRVTLRLQKRFRGGYTYVGGQVYGRGQIIIGFTKDW
jgi:hypothetical protein